MIHNTSTKGFTLIETLVAIAIIMVAITGPFVATENSINAVTVAHDKSIAVFLAQEGIEYIHAIRDKVYIKECFSTSGINCDNWWSIFTTNSYGSGYNVSQCSSLKPCTLDSTKSQYVSMSPFVSGALSFCAGGSSGICNQLYLTPSPSYSYTTSPFGNTPTIFYRKIVITKINSTTIKVNVTITWKEQGSNYSITADDMLTSWE